MELSETSLDEIAETYLGFCGATETHLNGTDLSWGTRLTFDVHRLCHYGLQSLVGDHFLAALESAFLTNTVSKFWRHFDSDKRDEAALYSALEEISLEKQYQEKCLHLLVDALRGYSRDNGRELFAKHHLSVSSVLMTTLPLQFPETLNAYFKGKLEELSSIMAGDDERDDMELDEKSRLSFRSGHMEEIDQGKFFDNNKLVDKIGRVQCSEKWSPMHTEASPLARR